MLQHLYVILRNKAIFGLTSGKLPMSELIYERTYRLFAQKNQVVFSQL